MYNIYVQNVPTYNTYVDVRWRINVWMGVETNELHMFYILLNSDFIQEIENIIFQKIFFEQRIKKIFEIEVIQDYISVHLWHTSKDFQSKTPCMLNIVYVDVFWCESRYIYRQPARNWFLI